MYRVQMLSSLLLTYSLVSIGVSRGFGNKFAVPRSLEENIYGRVRRKTNKEKQGFTLEEKQKIVQKHNDFRRIPNAADMLYMSWDNDLENLAQSWVNQCKYGHNPNIDAGENLFAASPDYNGETAGVISWNDEVSDYTYSDNSCIKTCGHYTQVVWAKSDRVGCAVNYCPTAEGLSWTDVYLVVCNYLEAGNLAGAQPYTEGQACSQCPVGKEICDNGLCRDKSGDTTTPVTSQTTSGTTTSVTSTKSMTIMLLPITLIELVLSS